MVAHSATNLTNDVLAADEMLLDVYAFKNVAAVGKQMKIVRREMCG